MIRSDCPRLRYTESLPSQRSVAPYSEQFGTKPKPLSGDMYHQTQSIVLAMFSPRQEPCSRPVLGIRFWRATVPEPDCLAPLQGSFFKCDNGLPAHPISACGAKYRATSGGLRLDSSRHPFSCENQAVGKSADAARKSACATVTA